MVQRQRSQRSDPPDTRDRGSTSLETAIVFPGMLLVVIMTFQFGLIAYSHHVLVNATQAAAAAAAAGEKGPDLLGSIDDLTDDATVTVDASDPDRITAIGEAKVISIIPIVPKVTVRASAQATVERFRPEGGG